MSKLRILAVMHDGLVPPGNVRGYNLADVHWKMEYDVTANLRVLEHEVVDLGVGDDIRVIAAATSEFRPHIIFNLIEDFHEVGTFDHNVVGFFELLRIPYTGCNPRGMMLARDKALSKSILAAEGIRVPWFTVVHRGRKPRLRRDAPYPLIVKSRTKDASHGISQASVVLGPKKLAERVEFIHDAVGTDAIVEQFIDGRELYVGAVGNRRPRLLPIWELHLNRMHARWRIATDRVKWNGSYQKRHGIRTRVAKSLPDELQRRILDVCRRAWMALDLSGYARLDLRLTPTGEIYFMEANPNPQLAYGEDFAEAAEHGGLDYFALLQRIVDLGLSWQPDYLG
jgi:D-alanine-D-alanine ligase